MTDSSDQGKERKIGYKPYEIGYGKPPKASQFKPGVSGNKKGRPKGKMPMLDELENNILLETRSVILGGKVRKMTLLEAIQRKQIDLALKGDTRAYNNLMSRVRNITDRTSRIPLSVTEMSDRELAILRDRIIEEGRKSAKPSSDG